MRRRALAWMAQHRQPIYKWLAGGTLLGQFAFIASTRKHWRMDLLSDVVGILAALFTAGLITWWATEKIGEHSGSATWITHADPVAKQVAELQTQLDDCVRRVNAYDRAMEILYDTYGSGSRPGPRPHLAARDGKRVG